MTVEDARAKKALFVGLTLELKKTNPKKYEYKKVKMWERILHQNLHPTKWMQPNKNGTGIHFEMMTTLEQVCQAQQELKEYVDQIKETYEAGSVED